MSGTNADSADLSDDELRMRLYELLHERARTERKWQFWRLAAGHLVISVIVAYVFLSSRWRLLALTPILYGIVVMDGLKYSIRLLHIERHLVAVESELVEREPLFGWVSEYGFFGSGQRIPVEDLDLNRIPELAQMFLIGTIYVTLVAISVLVWSQPESSGFGVSRELLLVSYGSFSLLVAIFVYIGYVHYKRVQTDIGATSLAD